MTDPDRIRREIERTQMSLSDGVDALTEKVSPGRIVRRRVSGARRAMRSATRTVMGGGPDDDPSALHRAASSVGGSVASAAATVGDATSSAAASVNDAVSSAPQAVRRQTTGNPLAAGLVAFGLGALVSSLLPASSREQQVAGQVKDTLAEHSEEIKQELTGAVQEVKENLREPSQQAAQAVRDTAADAAATVRDEGRYAAQDVRDQASRSAQQATGG